MFNLPKDTEFNKRVPKKMFYENIEISPKVKKIFTEELKTIYWTHKIAEETVNISKGNNVDEIEVIMLRLNQKSLDESVLLQMDRGIPYHILYVMEYEGMYRMAIGYKEESKSSKNAFKVEKYYYSDWMEEEEISIPVEGIDMDRVYENILRSIAGDRLSIDEDEDISESIERDKRIEAVEKQIKAITSKIGKEKQFKKQMKLSDERRELIKELENLKNI